MRNKKIDFEWESLDNKTQRAKVYGGWIVQYSLNGYQAIGLTFIPDTNHQWKVK